MNFSLEWLPWYWWILGIGLIILEVAFPTTFLIWVGVAALATGLLAWLLPMPFALQMVICAALSLLAVWLGKQYFQAAANSDPDTELNTGAHRLVGRQVLVVSDISNGVGRVRVGDSEWRAVGPDVPSGESVTIVDVDGSTLCIDVTSAPSVELLSAPSVELLENTSLKK